jgi:hypothetical protein
VTVLLGVVSGWGIAGELDLSHRLSAAVAPGHRVAPADDDDTCSLTCIQNAERPGGDWYPEGCDGGRCIGNGGERAGWSCGVGQVNEQIAGHCQ